VPTTIPALVATVLVMSGAWWLLRRQRQARDRELRSNLLTAMDLLVAVDNDLSRLRGSPQFLKACAAALGGSEDTISARAEFYSDPNPQTLSAW
jgi:hypothetical protein